MSASANHAVEPALTHAAVMIGPGTLSRLSGRALSIAATSWFVVAIAGQLMFAAYVIALYGRAAATGQLARWNAVLPHGYVPGDTLANSILGVHLLFTVAIIVGGAIQLTPGVRRVAPAIHRWNGRLYIVSALAMGTGGLIMLATRNPVGDLLQHVATGLNGLLILIFAVIAWRLARARRFDQHRRWALRLFLVVSGVWFFRIGLTASLVLNRGPFGFDPETFQGPFLSFLAFAQYLLPLAVLEIYFWTRAHAGPVGHLTMATGLVALTLLTALGIAAASMIFWLPKM